MLGRGEQEDFVARLDDRVAFRENRLVVTEDGGDAGIHVGRQMLAHLLDRLADQHAAFVGAHGDQGDPPLGEIEHLQGFRKFDQAADVVGDDLFRAQGEIDSKIVYRQ